MTILEIIELSIIGVAVLAIGIYCIVMAIKNKWLSKILSTIKTAIAEAEQKWPEGHGDEKKEYVLEKVKEKCNELGIPYEVLYKLINKLIKSTIASYNVVKKGE